MENWILFNYPGQNWILSFYPEKALWVKNLKHVKRVKWWIILVKLLTALSHNPWKLDLLCELDGKASSNLPLLSRRPGSCKNQMYFSWEQFLSIRKEDPPSYFSFIQINSPHWINEICFVKNLITYWTNGQMDKRTRVSNANDRIRTRHKCLNSDIWEQTWDLRYEVLTQTSESRCLNSDVLVQMYEPRYLWLILLLPLHMSVIEGWEQTSVQIWVYGGCPPVRT